MTARFGKLDPAKPNARRLIGKSLLAMASLAVSLLALEMILRSTLGMNLIVLPLCGMGPTVPGISLGGLEPDPVLGFHGVPDARLRYRHLEHPYGLTSCRRNHLGFHMQEEVRTRKPRGTFRVLILGDSQTEGLVTNDTEETYPHLLQRHLRTALSPLPVEVINGAVAGYSPWHCFLWYKRYGERLNPDLVILAFYSGNDPSDLLALDRVLDSMNAYLEFAKSSCKLCFAATRLLERPSPASRPPAGMRKIWDFQRTHRKKRSLLSQSLSQNFLYKRYPEQFSLVMNRTKIILDLFEKEMRQKGKPWLVALLPTKLQVEPEEDAEQILETIRLLRLAQTDLRAEEQVENALSRFCHERGIRLVDLRAILTEAHRATGTELYGHRHWHLNAAGNRVAAAALARFLAEARLLPKTHHSNP